MAPRSLPDLLGRFDTYWRGRRPSPLVQPLAAAVVVGAGTFLVAFVAGLVGARDGAAIHIAGETGGQWRRGEPLLFALPEPLHLADRDFEAALAQLKAGPFGVELRPRAGIGDARRFSAVVLVDAEAPPLRVAIMGMQYPAVPREAARIATELRAGAP